MYQKNEKNKKKLNIDTKKMGIDIDKNEYREIVLSNSNLPETSFKKRDSIGL